MNRKEEIKVKEERVRKLLEFLSLDGVIFKKRSNFSWFTGGGINMVPVCTELGFSTILVTSKEKYVISNRIEAARNMEEEKLQDFDFNLLEYDGLNLKSMILLRKSFLL
jgi:Xaa-Pro aminopeptidase